MTEFEIFFNSFIETALWSSSDINKDSDTSLQNEGYTIDSFDEESLTKLKGDCLNFFNNNYSKIKNNLELAGHDFWLTSQRHGAGFWDGNWEKEIGNELTKDSHEYSERNFYVINEIVYCD